MHLPVELVEAVLDYLPPYDKESLRSSSLIAKSWLDPCQRRLFESVHIFPMTCESWRAQISPDNTVLLSHVRELVYGSTRTTHGYRNPPRRLGDDVLRFYLPSLCQLQRLTFGNVDIGPPIQENPSFFFFASQHSLSSLILLQVSIKWSGFITLLGYLHNLRNLEVRQVLFKDGLCPTPRPSCALRGRILVHWDLTSNPFIGRFAGMDPEYEEIVFTDGYNPDLVDAVGSSLKCLRITQGTCTPFSYIHRPAAYIGYLDLLAYHNLTRCSELRELEITRLPPHEEERRLISTITSANLRKIIFTPQDSRLDWDLLRHHYWWPPFDDMICGLVDRLQVLGHKGTLEVVFQAVFVDLENKKVNHERILPKFKEKGRVRIVETSSGNFREWP